MAKIYAFVFSDCIYESAAETVSLHTTEDGARKAMKKYIDNFVQRHNSIAKECGLDIEYDPLDMCYYDVVEMEVCDD